MKPILKTFIILGSITCITPNYVFAVNTEASTVTKHTMGDTIDDQTLTHSVNEVLEAQLPEGSFTIASFNQKVLLTGQVPSSLDKSKAETAVANTSGVTKVWNYLTVEGNENSQAIAHDAYLTSAAKTRLVAQKGVNANNIKVVTSNKVVYLLGSNAGTPSQIKDAVKGVKQINDVSKVINLID